MRHEPLEMRGDLTIALSYGHSNPISANTKTGCDGCHPVFIIWKAIGFDRSVEAFPKKIPVQLGGNQSEVNCSLSRGDSPALDYIIES